MLRYIHANPKAAGMQEGFFYDFSNYGVYDRLGDDGLTTWHPAFLALGEDFGRMCCAHIEVFVRSANRNRKQKKAILGVINYYPK